MPQLGEHTGTILKKRMTQIDDVGEVYYRLINKTPLIRGTSDSDEIDIDIRNQEISVTIRTEVDDQPVLHYQKVFNNEYTDHITILGIEGDDKFNITQSGNPKIKLRLVGGYGDDSYNSEKNTSTRIQIVEDMIQEGNECASCRTTITDSKSIHVVDRSDFMLPYNYFLPSLEFNDNEGLFVGGVMNWFHPGYKSMAQHTFNFSHATKSKSYQFGYEFMLNSKLNNSSYFAD